MTSEGQRALAKTIRALRERLLADLHDATEGAYRLGLKPKDAKLSEAPRLRRERLDAWVAEQVRALPGEEQKGAAERFRLEVEKDAASTLLNRIVYLRLLEAAGLRAEKVVTGGWESRGYKDFREFAPELVRRDESEGYATLLRLIFDDLATELPGLYGDVRLISLVPVPAAALRAVVEALDAPELRSCWLDDTTLGWVYQYWNDPEREALDARLNQGYKLQNHEIAPKTQMFTERYMVEWLLHNTLGQTWLAMCRKHGWTPEVEAHGTLARLEERRQAWRAKREAGEVALDALMPIEGEEEAHWKYWVPQPMPEDAPGHAPESLRDLKLLDPACGSGHFLVIAADLLFALHREEARHRGEEPDDRTLVESILERNLHGIDIDPRAVQIAAAALMLKARQLCPEARPRRFNLVAPQLRLAGLPDDDPARVALIEGVEREAGIPAELTQQVLDALAGADHLGTLLRLDVAVDAAIRAHEERLRRSGHGQGELFGEAGRDPPAAVDAEGARATLLDRLEVFLRVHSHGDDLGLKLRGEQLGAGLRFVRLVREGQYDIVVGNPPYQGTSKMADAKYVAKHYPKGKADLYAAFLERGLQLARQGGVSGLLTMRNWMFIKQYAGLREWLLESFDLRTLGDVDRGAFEEVPDEVVAAVMSVLRSFQPSAVDSVAMQPTPLEDRARDSERTRRKRAAVLCQVGRFEFRAAGFDAVPQKPMLYWWSESFRQRYREAPKLGDKMQSRVGIRTSNNGRFVRRPWEIPHESLTRIRVEDPMIPLKSVSYVPHVMGPAGARWFEALDHVIDWTDRGLAVCVTLEHAYGAYPQSTSFYFKPAIAFPQVGAAFSARAIWYRSVIDVAAPCVFPKDVAAVTCLLNSRLAADVLHALNPTIHFQPGDVDRVPMLRDPQAREILDHAAQAFVEHASHREPSIEFTQPGPSPWRHAQDWAQGAVDRTQGEPLPPYEPMYDPEQSTDHISFALGVALGRLGAHGEGILEKATADSLPHGILFLSAAADVDGLVHAAARVLVETWAIHGQAIDPERSLKDYLQTRFFSDVHRKMYENRPIYFPHSSERRSFVAYVSIHRWTEHTLRALLAEHLHPALTRLEGEIADLREARQGADAKAARDAERRFAQVDRWKQELQAFIANVEQCAEKGPPPPDAQTPAREVDTRYAPDLDDGVMINSAALWPLLEPQWKDPKRWWKELASAQGKKDYDWAHLAARYFPARVDAKCRKDPSLAVAHGCFWKYHPAAAYKWELRLQDEIGPDFTLDEEGSDEARAAFEAAHPGKVAELVAAEKKRRERKRRKQSQDSGSAGPLFDAAERREA